MHQDRKKKNIFELTHCGLDDYREKRKLPLAVLIDNIRSMQNTGAIFRTADAFLIDQIVICGISGTPPHPEISKTALGAEESVNWRYAEDAVGEVQRMKSEGWSIVVLEQTHGSIPLHKLKIEKGKKYLLVAGNEVEGVNQKIVDMADCIAEIPQHGVKHSLNVATSTGIALWEMYKYLITNT